MNKSISFPVSTSRYSEVVLEIYKIKMESQEGCEMKRYLPIGMVLVLVTALVIISGGVSAYGLVQNPVGEIDGAEFSGIKQQSGVEDKNMKILAMRIYNFAGVEMLQLRELADELDWTLTYTPEKKTVIRKKGFSFTLDNDNNLSWTTGATAAEDVGGLLIKDGRTYLSLSKAGELLEQMGEELLLTGLYTDKSVYKKDDNIKVLLCLYNFTSRTMRLNFGSGQRYDLYLLQDKEEIWRWSEDKFFTMALVFKELEPGGGLSYNLDLEFQPDAGEYILGGELATIPEPIDSGEILIKIEEDKESWLK